MKDGLPQHLLLTDIQLLDQAAITRDVLLREIIKEAAALAYHLQKSTLAVMVLRVLLEVWGQGVDVGGQEGDLYLRAT